MSTMLGLMNGDDINGPEDKRVSNKDLTMQLLEYAGFYSTEPDSRARMDFPQDMELGHWNFLIGKIDGKGTQPADIDARVAYVRAIEPVLYFAERKVTGYITVSELRAKLNAR